MLTEIAAELLLMLAMLADIVAEFVLMSKILPLTMSEFYFIFNALAEIAVLIALML